MGQTLTNGLYLPDEGERYCYDGLASNWTILDAVVGGYNAHIENTTIHISSEERIKWNTGVTQAYVLRYASSSVSANSTVAYSSLDNVDNVKIGDKVLDQDGKMYSVTVVDSANSQITVGALLIDLSKDSDLSNYYTKAEVDALDSNAMHKSGSETINGAKTFTNEIINNITNTTSAYITLKNSQYDPKTNGQSNANACSFSIIFKTLTDNGFAYISAYGLPEYSLLRLTTTYFTDSENSITDSIEYRIYQNGDKSLRPRNNNNCMLGEIGKRWKDCQTYLINGLTPSSLSFPKVSNKIDISGYITDLTGGSNTYTPPANGWICIQTDNSSVNNYIACDYDVIRVKSSGNGQASGLSCLIPVISNTQVSVRVVCTTLSSAYFIPCLGNI